MERKINKTLVIFLLTSFIHSSVNLILKPSPMELISLTIISPCGRADENTSGLLSTLFLYQREKWRKDLWNSGARVETYIGVDSSYFRIISLKNYWSTSSKITSSLIYDSQIDLTALARAKRLISLSMPRPVFSDFGPFLFYPMSEYGRPFPTMTDIMRITPKDLASLKQKCFSPRRVKVVVEGGFISSVIKNSFSKGTSKIIRLQRLMEPPDRPPIKVGFITMNDHHVVWFFKIIERREIIPVEMLINSLALKPDGLFHTMFTDRVSITSGIKLGRNVSFGWIDLKILKGSTKEIFFLSRRVIKGKMRSGIDQDEFERIKKYMRGKQKYEESLPWPAMRAEWKSIRMQEKGYSLNEINSVLRSFPSRSLSALITGSEESVKDILQNVSSIGVFDSTGRFLYELSSE